MDTNLPLPHLNATLLEPPVRAALGKRELTVTEWTITLLSRQGRRGVYRVTGTARDAAGAYPWSIVLKTLQVASEDALANELLSDWAYWKREALVYQAGFVADLPGGLVAPRCYGVREQSATEVWIWLEPLAPDPTPWPLARYGLAARHLGSLNGAYLTGRPRPVAPWLSADWLRTRTADRAALLARIRDPATWEHPLLRRAFPVPVADRILALWGMHETWLAARARLPRTFCHLDAWRGNLISRQGAGGQEETVALDWAFAGTAAVGEEIAALIWVTPLEFLLDPTEIDALEGEVFEGYVAGLRDVGWTGNPRQARLGYLINAVLQWGVFPEALAYALDPDLPAQAAARYGRPVEELVEATAVVTYALLGRSAEILRLLTSVI
jgi:hypothetical protein